MIKFYIIKPPKELVYLYLKDENGQTFFKSCGHGSRKGIKRGLEIIRENAKLEKRYQKFDVHDLYNRGVMHYHFVLTAGNGHEYGRSPTYKTPEERDAALAIFKAHAVDAEVVDLAPEVTW